MRNLPDPRRTAAFRYRPSLLLAVAGLVAVLLCGCGRHAASPASKPVARPLVVTKDGTPLPEWAPAKPSPEFLRAARFVQPIRETPGADGGIAGEAGAAHLHRALVPAWELLGSLSDEQLAELASTREVRLPVKSLTEKQRALLDHGFAVWRQEMKAVPGWPADALVELYKGGAREDLSDVTLSFRIRGSNRVAAFFCVTKSDGTQSPPFAFGLGDFVQRKGGK